MTRLRDFALWAIVVGLLIQGFLHGYRNGQEKRQRAEEAAHSAPR